MRITDALDELGWEYSQPVSGIDVYSLHGHHMFETRNYLEWVVKKDGDIDYVRYLHIHSNNLEELKSLTREIKINNLLIVKK